ncbi:PIR protein [Plasmodium yoelii]|uniref:PIR protein n=2 Tax=Plasmodium yoelii TaxID=5861 RepID=A0AAE9WK40_PLAYO|nr:PIR protein [Plasmodium yoelii]WBY55473.1 PIR protein [Plasmodium yoelii yoelii]CDU20338.1 YIR protein [Plasmodium yoelii]VTZ73982.1 PIR protein [Plasmodium yoelii]|eukprot:XP_022811141.1 PIR protein [Plasmodium yoelii]
MDKDVFNNFIYVMTNLEYDSNKKKYKFNDDTNFKGYCTGDCDNDLDKINAGCLYFFNAFFKNSDLFSKYANNYMNIVEYIMIWLSYMLTLKENNSSSVSHLQHFYDTYINGSGDYKQSINGVKDNSSYMDLLNKKNYFLNIDIKDISKLYDAFQSLCKMYTGFDENMSNCTNCLQYAKKFAENIEEINKKPNIVNNSSYKQILYTLSTDYYNLKNNCKNCSSFPEIETSIYALTSEDASSSSSIASKLFIVLSIFAALPIFLGISYKYSLFGFRKRFQKLKLREKIKNIKKRMNH